MHVKCRHSNTGWFFVVHVMSPVDEQTVGGLASIPHKRWKRLGFVLGRRPREWTPPCPRPAVDSTGVFSNVEPCLLARTRHPVFSMTPLQLLLVLLIGFAATPAHGQVSYPPSLCHANFQTVAVLFAVTTTRCSAFGDCFSFTVMLILRKTSQRVHGVCRCGPLSCRPSTMGQ
jgi:hypothetical protein